MRAALPCRVSRRTWLGATAAALAQASCDWQRGASGRPSAALWFTYGGKNREVLERLVTKFNRSQAAHHIQPVFQGDYYEGLAKLRTAIFARAAPALSHVVGEVIPYLARAGALEPLAGYPGAQALGVVDALGQSGTWTGGAQRALVALPFNRSTPVAYLNGALFERAGLAAPGTWDELRACARALTEVRPDGTRRYGFGCPIDWWFWVALVQQAGGRIIEPDGRVSLGGQAGVEAIELWKTLVLTDRSMKPPPGRDYNAWEQTNQDFLAGRTAMLWTSTAFLKYLEKNAPFPVVAAPLPGRERRAVPTGGTFWVVLRQAPPEQKATAWAFLRFMHEPENVIEWATETGYLPVTTSAIERLTRSGYYAAHPNDRVALDQLQVAQPWPWSPQLFQVQREVVQPRLEQAVFGGGRAAQVLQEARQLAAEGL